MLHRNMTGESALNPLPLLLAGPVLRRVEARRLVLWLATSEPVQLRLRVAGQVVPLPETGPLAAGGRLFHHLIDAALPEPLVPGAWTPYTLEVADPAAPADAASVRASSVLPVPGSPLTRRGRSSVTAALTARLLMTWVSVSSPRVRMRPTDGAIGRVKPCACDGDDCAPCTRRKFWR